MASRKRKAVSRVFRIRELNRLLVVAPPGQGKTTLLTHIVKTYRTGGFIFDPLGDYEGIAGRRWYVETLPRLSVASDEEKREIGKRLLDLEPGALVIGDEFGRFLPGGDPNNPLLQFFDVARNRGVRFAFAEKRPTRLNPLVTDLVDIMAWRPWRSASARRWMAEADIPPDLPDPGDFTFYICGTAGEVGKIGLWELGESIGKSLNLEEFSIDSGVQEK